MLAALPQVNERGHAELRRPRSGVSIGVNDACPLVVILPAVLAQQDPSLTIQSWARIPGDRESLHFL